MTNKNDGPSWNDVNAFSLSGIPWVTSSGLPASGTALQFSFPLGSRTLFIRNSSAAASVLRFGFSQNGVLANPPSNAHYIALSQSQEVSLELRTREMFFASVSGAPIVDLVVGLSNVTYSMMPIYSGTIDNVDYHIFNGVG